MQADDGEEALSPSSPTAALASQRCSLSACHVRGLYNWYTRIGVPIGEYRSLLQGSFAKETYLRGSGISEVRSLRGLDTTALAALLPTLPVGLACHGRSSVAAASMWVETK